MRKLKLLFVFVFAHTMANAQNGNLDSLHAAYAGATSDSIKYQLLSRLYSFYFDGNRDSALYFAEQQLQVAQRSNKKLEMAASLNSKGYQLRQKGRFGASLECYLEAIKIAENPKSEKTIWTLPNNSTPENVRLNRLASVYHNFGHLLGNTDNISQQVLYYLKTKELTEKTNNKRLTQLAFSPPKSSQKGINFCLFSLFLHFFLNSKKLKYW